MKTGRFLQLLSVLFIMSCATSPSVRVASDQSDADAKRFIPPEGRSNLYVAWSSSSADRPFSLDIVVDGKTVGPIVPGMFYLVAIDPGKHSVAASGRLYSSKVTLASEAGKNYFFELTATSEGFSAQPSLGVVLLEDMGKIMVRQNKRAQSSLDQ